MGREGIYYEVNADHPMVNALEKEYPGIRPKLELLLKQIGMSLPINALYLDLTNDEKLENDGDSAASEIIALLKNFIAFEQTVQGKRAMVEELKITEPFCLFVEEIDAAATKGELYD